MNNRKAILITVILAISCISAGAQSITGVWRGKIKGVNTELKLVKNGDELVGIAYYYQNKSKYKRYSIKGHFDTETNAVVWWDDLLLSESSTQKHAQSAADAQAQLMVADFNCPGEEEMFLDGNSSSRDNKQQQNGLVHLEKKTDRLFADEWDYIIDNYFTGTNDPELIDSISRYGLTQNMPEEQTIEPAEVQSIPAEAPFRQIAAPAPVAKTSVEDAIEKKFIDRKNVLQTVIPITAKTIELRFYDNAQVDGDSIAIFLNGKLLYKNIRLTEQPYTILIEAATLQADNELVMVAENLGSIPPNTSYLVAIVGDKRYEARLFANEKSSALVRIVAPQAATAPR
jgi:hypothetical protein